MKKAISLAIVLACVVISALLFLESDFLKNTLQKKIGKRLSALPCDIAFALRDFSFFPPELYFSSIHAGKNGTPILGLKNCRLKGVLALVAGKAPRICVECESGEMLFEDYLKGYPLGRRSIANAGKSVGFSHAVLNLTIHRFRLLTGSESRAFVFRGKYEANQIHAFLESPGRGRGRPFLEIRGRPAGREAELRFRHIDLKTLIRLVFRETGNLPTGKAGGSARLFISETGAIDLTADLDISDLLFSHRLIDAKPVRLPLARVRGKVWIDVSKKCFRLIDTDISLKGFTMDIRGEARGKQYQLRLSTERLALNDFARLLDDPLFDGFLMKGFLQVALSLKGDMEQKRAITELELKGGIEEVKQLSRRLHYLHGDFAHPFKDRAGNRLAHAVGQGNPDYVALNTMPEFIYKSVVFAEDAAFFGHKGIDFREAEAALKDYIEISRMRGGSTITQQLAKNLFLTKDRNIMRKLKEMVLAVELDASLSKRRILEIYLNIIEWGPGILGIGHAARHYFGKPAAMLTPLEAAYLASIIPNPKRFYVHYLRGIVNPNWRERVNQILELMYLKGTISPEQFHRALAEHIAFSKDGG
jgi:hypothetical protein